MLNATMCGTDTVHPKGYQFKRSAGMPYWLLMRFHTPFYYVCDGVTLYGEADQLLLQPPEFPIIHGAPDSFDGGFRNDWVYIEGDEISAMVKELGLPVNLPFFLEEYGFFDRAMAEIETEIKDFDLGYGYKVSGLLYSLLADMGRKRITSDAVVSITSHSDIAPIQRVHNAITKNLAYPWTLSDMAELSGYSVSRFCALYKDRYGISPIERLIRVRMDKAKNLLMSGECNVTETAELCGFSSVHYFSASFKRYVGCSPKTFVETGERGRSED